MMFKVLSQIPAQMLHYTKLDLSSFPAYPEAKEKEEVLFCLLSVEQTACCTVGEEGTAAPLLVCLYLLCSVDWSHDAWLISYMLDLLWPLFYSAT